MKRRSFFGAVAAIARRPDDWSALRAETLNARPRWMRRLLALHEPHAQEIHIHRQAITEQRVREAIIPILDALVRRTA